MKRHTIIDIRPDGAHVVPDPYTTLVHHYAPDFLAAAGAVPQDLARDHDTEEVDIMPAAASAVETAYKTATSAALGAYFDAVIAEGFEIGLAQKLLGMAFENLKVRGRTPEDAIRGLFEDAP